MTHPPGLLFGGNFFVKKETPTGAKISPWLAEGLIGKLKGSS